MKTRKFKWRICQKFRVVNLKKKIRLFFVSKVISDF